MKYKKTTKYTEEEINKIREEYVNTPITLKDLVTKYNISDVVKKSFVGLKTYRPKTNLPQDRIDEIVNYYINNDVEYKDMKLLFNLSDWQCYTFLSGKKKKYNKYDDKYWEEVIIPEYMKDGVERKHIYEMFNVSKSDMSKRFKGLKKVQINIGDTNNKLTIIDINIPPALSSGRLKRMVRVKCECGTVFDTFYVGFKNSSVKSCGCLLYKALGHSVYYNGNSPEGKRTYTSYSSMKGRCLNPDKDKYPYYGGRGITICDRWLNLENGYKNFLEDMGYRPEGMTLDRIDVDGNYEPSNCRWANKSLQSINQRRYSHIKQYSDDEWVDIEKDYVENNLTQKEICDKYSVASTQVSNRFTGIKKIENEMLWETINEYYKEHKVTHRELCEIFGVKSWDCVKYLIKD